MLLRGRYAGPLFQSTVICKFTKRYVHNTGKLLINPIERRRQEEAVEVAGATANTSDTSTVKVTPDSERRTLIVDAPSYGLLKSEFPYVWLRDVCQGEGSVDPSTKQKLFETSEIDERILVDSVKLDSGIEQKKKKIERQQQEENEKGKRNEKDAEPVLSILWDRNSLRGATSMGKDNANLRESRVPLSLLAKYGSREAWMRWTREDLMEPITWHRNQLAQQPNLKISYKDFVNSEEIRFMALRQLIQSGILFLTNVPTEDKSDDGCELAKLGDIFGDIRRTWYGDKVWDVKSTENSKNVAYTNLSLGLHMDLVHYENPPRYQLLHYLHRHPRLSGGESYFVDSYRIAELIRRSDPEIYKTLTNTPVAFEYRNGGHWRHFERPTFEERTLKKPLQSSPPPSSSSSSSSWQEAFNSGENTDFSSTYPLNAINYSPPFQAPQLLHELQSEGFNKLHKALQEFSKLCAEPELTFRIDLQPGDCVIFDNRRVLHARDAFEVVSEEEEKGNESKKEPEGNYEKMPIRWLKGMYVEGDSVKDRFRVLSEQLSLNEET